MSAFRATFFFEQGKYGWSETFFRDAANHDQLIAPATNLAKLRIKLCGTGVALTYVRISDDAVKRDAIVLNPRYTTAVVEVPAPGPAFPVLVPPALELPPDLPYSAVLLRMNSPFATTWRMHYLRGVPDVVNIFPNGPANIKAWDTAYSKWTAALRDEGWLFKALDKDGTTNPIKAVSGCSGAAPWVLTVVGHGLVNGDIVRVSGMKGVGSANVNGLWTIDAVDANSIRLRNSGGVYTFDRGGTVRLQKYKLYVIDSVVVRGETHRDTGRPFDSPVGRRKAR